AKVLAGGNWTIVIDGLGQARITGIGAGNLASPDPSTDYLEIASGGNQFCRLIVDPANSANQLLQCGSSPVGALSTVSFPVGGFPTDVSVGTNHACAVFLPTAQSARVYCWGDNSVGQLGTGALGAAAGLSLPTTAVGFGPGEVPEKVFAANGFSCASLVKSGGRLIRCWGASAFGQLGIGASPLYQAIPAMPNPLQYTIDSSGQVYPTIGALVPPQNPLGLQSSAGTLAAAAYNCASFLDHTIRCWGQDAISLAGGSQYGLLGPQSGAPPKDRFGLFPADMSALAAVPLPSADTTKNALGLSIGERHACALYTRTDQMPSIFCWGGNDVGQLGNGQSGLIMNGASGGDFIDGNLAVKGIAFNSPVSLVSGFEHTCTVRSDNRVMCWGNAQGWSPLSAPQAQYTPVTVFDAMQ
ncbi:MAG: RCC1 domain-containing protein, partial [Bdellovibrionota bacterium]